MKCPLLCALAIALAGVAVAQDLRVAPRKDGEHIYGYVDRSGAWIIKPQFLEASGWENGVARVRLLDGRLAFIDPQGTYLMRPRKFGRLSDLSEGLASFEREASEDEPRPTVGFIDFQGRVVIPPRFYMAYDFSAGVASASVEFGKCGYIDKTALVAQLRRTAG